MCLLVFGWRCHANYKLVLAANRDEFHERPTCEARWWPDQPDILGGRDLEAGGTWLGLHRRGRLALVTNYREPGQRPARAPSRGELVRKFLAGGLDIDAYAREIRSIAERFAGFNLLLCDGRKLLYFCNRGKFRQNLAPGIYGLSNHRLDTPWPKVVVTKKRFAGIVRQKKVDTLDLITIIGDSRPFEDSALPDTGIGRELERLLSAPFVISKRYGTRCSTALTWDMEDRLSFFERSFDAQGVPTNDARFEFQICHRDDA